jgi:hypothetical protein
MKNICEHPWQRGPSELFEFAMTASQAKNDVNQRIAFLLFDVCVETTLRTYLSLPDGASDSKLAYSERRKFASGKFHELTKGVGLAAGDRVSAQTLEHLKFFHGIRNNLYHQGNGVSVRSDHVKEYADLASILLNQLLEIDCAAKKDPAIDQRAFDALKREFPKEVDQFHQLINELMESTEPRMIYPSTIRALKEASNFNVSSFPRKLQEFRTLIESNLADNPLKSWLLNFLADDLSSDHPQVIANTEFLMGMGEDPVSFYSLLIGIRWLPMEDVSLDTLDRYDDISFIAQHEYSLMGLYSCCQHFVDLLGKEEEKRFGLSDYRLFERCKDLQSNLREAIKRLREFRPNHAR